MSAGSGINMGCGNAQNIHFLCPIVCVWGGGGGGNATIKIIIITIEISKIHALVMNCFYRRRTRPSKQIIFK